MLKIKFESPSDKDRLMLVILFVHLPIILLYSFFTDHVHVNLISLPTYLGSLLVFLWKPGSFLSRVSIAVSMVIFSAILIHLSHGLIEMHFHVFVILVILSLYNDWKVFALAAVGVALHHLVGLVVPLYDVYAPNPNLVIYGLHILFVGLECIFLAYQIHSHHHKIAVISQQKDSLVTATRRLLKATVTLNSTAGQQADGSERQVLATAQVVETLHELNVTVQSIAGRIKHINQATQEVVAASQHVNSITQEVSAQGDLGVQATKQVVASNEAVGAFYSQLFTTLGELQNQSAHIAQIINTITHISDQTHLLGLNAVIEAAGAGKFGARFIVVAREVQALADHTINSSKQITHILSQVELQIQKAVITATNGQSEINQAINLAKQSGTVMKELSGHIHRNAQETHRIEKLVDKVNLSTHEISEATNQLNLAFGQVVQTMEEIGLVAKETVSGSYDINHTARKLEELSSQLKLSLSA